MTPARSVEFKVCPGCGEEFAFKSRLKEIPYEEGHKCRAFGFVFFHEGCDPPASWDEPRGEVA